MHTEFKKLSSSHIAYKESRQNLNPNILTGVHTVNYHTILSLL